MALQSRQTQIIVKIVFILEIFITTTMLYCWLQTVGLRHYKKAPYLAAAGKIHVFPSGKSLKSSTKTSQKM